MKKLQDIEDNKPERVDDYTGAYRPLKMSNEERADLLSRSDVVCDMGIETQDQKYDWWMKKLQENK